MSLARSKAAGSVSPFTGKHALLIVAHCDDEVLFAGGQFRAFGKLTIVHVTDSTLPPYIVQRKGFQNPTEYANARREEFRAALAVADVTADCVELGYPNVVACFHMAAAARRLAVIISETDPDIILTHPFEGGHPDHDTVAFAVRAALRRLARPPPLWEFGGYHRKEADGAYGTFLSLEGVPEQRVELGPSGFELKRRMLGCFESQRDIVSAFALTAEFFRLAPSYDFNRPPAPRPLNYEAWGWGVNWELWRALAAAAGRELAGWRGWGPARWVTLRARYNLCIHRLRVNYPRAVQWAKLRPRKIWLL